MKESEKLIECLKQVLKSKKITYEDLSKKLRLSESSIKRIFSEKSFSLGRFEEVCSVAGITLAELSKLSQTRSSESKHEYTLEQERFFASKPKFLAYFDLIIQGKSPRSIEKEFQLTSVQTNRYLKQLENLGLILRLPNDRVKLLVSKNVVWREKGPLRSSLAKKAREEFFESAFQGKNEEAKFLTLQLSESSLKKLLHQLEKIETDFTQAAELESTIQLRRKNVGIFMAVRPWNFSILSSLN